LHTDMLKYAACLAVAGAVDTEAPVISLNLDALRQPYKLANRIEHTASASAISGDAVKSFQDYSVRCAAKATDVTACPSPEASAFDHHDGSLAVTTKIFLVNDKPANDGAPITAAQEVAQVDYLNRGTYLFKYDARDASNNDAEQVVFAMILDDLEAPDIKYESAGVFTNEQIVEASSEWKLNDEAYVTITVSDNIDSDEALLKSKTVYKVEELTYKADTDTNEFQTKTVDASGAKGYTQPGAVGLSAAADLISTTKTCNTCKDSTNCDTPSCVYRVTMKAHDFAGIYGHDGQDNVRTHSVTLEVRDTRKPVIHVLGKSPKTVECVIIHKDFYEEQQWDQSWKADGQCVGKTTLPDYCSEGAKVLDLLDSADHATSLPYTVAHTVDVSAVTDYTVTFSATDTSGNPADEISRTVHVVDTVKPTITMTDQVVTVEHTVATDSYSTATTSSTHSWSTLVGQGGVSCADACSPDGDLTVTSRWSGKDMVSVNQAQPFHNGVGTYVQTYTCEDEQANTVEKARTYHVVDNDKPVITLVGLPEVTQSAGKNDADIYTDSGATCSDFADGQIDHQVVISGDVVNMRVPGTYFINFECEDSSGNIAPSASRTVFVVDDECPIISLIGASEVTVEAGFPYEDLGATATDTLDGDLTTLITQDGDLSAAHFQSMHSCAEIKSHSTGTANTLNTGNYNIMVTVGTDKVFKPVHCDFDGARDLTMYIHKSINLITPYQADQGECTSLGMDMPTLAWIQANKAHLKAYADNIDQGNCPECVWAAGQPTTDYFCVPKTGAEYDDFHTKDAAFFADYDKDKTHSATRRTKATIKAGLGGTENLIASSKFNNGVYKITFSVYDHAGNGAGANGFWFEKAADPKCSVSQVTRTVFVKDTLPPVITLTLKDKLIQTSDASQVGANGVYNPAGRRTDTTHHHHSGVGHQELLVKGNPFLDTFSAAQHEVARPFAGRAAANHHGYMAEQTSSNGWIIAAAASAVAGVALMGYSMKSTARMTVPV